ncbi:hypothetical protein GpartN1_g7549.t1 [Galdieria partita]|uniref:GB1/RHD3-type G domain-containing protein n=1 Tax=Galdieria partita TaxID=83374 RepID=A0A9C7UUD9_9RHOD|nr:hypothetical protein GpartN1_g7549.t1 [Galdieria partita]
MTSIQIVDSEGVVLDAPFWFPDDQELGSEAYAVVSILGSQGSGKSTLLNKIFQTNFVIADKRSFGKATTKGIHAAKCQQNSLLVVMDVEGADSRERGVSGKAFQSRIAGFASAISDVVLINLWFHDVGRTEAVSYSLLRAIFIEAAKAAAEGGAIKTLMCFVVRDSDPSYTSEELKDILLQGARDIWSTIPKTGEAVNAKLDDFFDFDLFALPHMQYEREQFDIKCKELKDRFLQESHPHFYLRSEYSKGIPADGFAAFSKNLWESVYENAEILSTGDVEAGQDELTAAYKCEEATSDILRDIAKETSKMLRNLEEGEKISNLGSKFRDLVNQCLARFDNAVSDVSSNALVSRKRRELEAIMDTSLNAIFVKQLQVLRENALSQFKASLSSEEVPSDFAFFTADSMFVREAEDSIRPGSDWSYNTERTDLQNTMHEISSRRKQLIAQQIQAAQQQASALQYLQMQQAQMQAIQQQQYGGSGGNWNFGAAYRPPETDVNISVGYQQHRTTIQVSMVPDESAGYLGPGGFTAGVGPGNLGLSFNINI